MATLTDLMRAVRGTRDALHARLDDNVSARVFTALRLRHTQAVIEARREVEDPTLKPELRAYDPLIAGLETASAAVKAGIATDEPAMLAATWDAGRALDRIERLPRDD